MRHRRAANEPGVWAQVKRSGGGRLAVVPLPTSANPAPVLVADIRAGAAIVDVVGSILVPRTLVRARSPGHARAAAARPGRRVCDVHASAGMNLHAALVLLVSARPRAVCALALQRRRALRHDPARRSCLETVTQRRSVSARAAPPRGCPGGWATRAGACPHPGHRAAVRGVQAHKRAAGEASNVRVRNRAEWLCATAMSSGGSQSRAAGRACLMGHAVCRRVASRPLTGPQLLVQANWAGPPA